MFQLYYLWFFQAFGTAKSLDANNNHTLSVQQEDHSVEWIRPPSRKAQNAKYVRSSHLSLLKCADATGVFQAPVT